MSLPVPVSERCIEALAVLLSGIHPDNGYDFAVSIQRSDSTGNPLGDPNSKFAIVIEDEMPQESPDDGPGTGDGWTMTVNCLCYYKGNAEDDGVNEKTMMQLIAGHVCKRHASDRMLARTAFTSNSGQATWGSTLGGLPAFQQPIEIIFWTLHDNPLSIHPAIGTDP